MMDERKKERTDSKKEVPRRLLSLLVDIKMDVIPALIRLAFFTIVLAAAAFGITIGVKFACAIL